MKNTTKITKTVSKSLISLAGAKTNQRGSKTYLDTSFFRGTSGEREVRRVRGKAKGSWSMV